MSRLVHYAPTGSDVHGDGTVLNPFQSREEAMFWAGEGDELCGDRFVSNQATQADYTGTRPRDDRWFLLVAGCMATVVIGFMVDHGGLAIVLAAAVAATVGIVSDSRKHRGLL